MKSIKFLAALAFPVMFAACANEEIVVDTPQKMQEVVGGELIGTDISLVASKGDVDSRFAGGKWSGWDTEDELGLAWVPVGEGPAAKQTEDGTHIDKAKVYNNLFFDYVEGEEGSYFQATGGVYKGYHFAYAPYQYTDVVGEMSFTINPEQTHGYTDATDAKDADAAYGKMLAKQLQMSAFYYLTGADLENKKLVKPISMKSPVSQIIVKTTAPAEENLFATHETLKNYKIDAVTFNLGKNVFAKEAKVVAKNLYRWNNTLEDAVNETEFVKSFAKALSASRKASITSTNSVAEYIVSASNPVLMTYVLPMTKKVTFADGEKYNVSIEVAAGGGKFVIKYQDGEFDPESREAINNKAIEDLIAAYSEDGLMVGQYNKQLVLNVNLYDAIFEADFENVTNDNWASKVQLANDLELSQEEAEFTLAESINLYGKKLPTNGVTVKGTADTKLIVDKKSYNWTEKLVIASPEINVEVAEDATLNLGKNAKIENAVTNKGTINVEANAILGKKTAGNLDNQGIVYVKYDGQVYPATDKHGVIALNVAKMTSKTRNVKAINEMIGASTDPEAGSANVNTLVIDNYELNCQMTVVTEGTTGSIYTPGIDDTSDVKDLKLAEVNLWIKNGGKVSSTKRLTTKDVEFENGGELANISVANVTVDGGEAAISNGAVSGNVTVKSGSATIADGDITGDVTVEAGSIEISNGDVKSITANGSVTMSNGDVAKYVTLNSGDSKFENVAIAENLTIKAGASVVLNSESTMNIGKIENNGTLTANNDIIVNDVTLAPGSTTTLTDKEVADKNWNKTIYYQTSYTHDKMTLNGTVLKYGDGEISEGKLVAFTAAGLQKALNEATGTTVITIGDDIVGNVTVPQSPDVKITIEGEGRTFAGVLLVDGKSGIYTTAGLTIKNLNFKAESISADACIQLGNDTDATRYTCNVTVEGCTFDVPGAVGVKSYTGGDKNLTIKGCTATKNAHSLVQVQNIDVVLIDGCYVYSKNGMNFNSSVNVTIQGTEANVRGYAVRFGAGSAANGATETYSIKECTLKSACDDGDAVIILRGTADLATLTIENTTIVGSIEITNTAKKANIIR